MNSKDRMEFVIDELAKIRKEDFYWLLSIEPMMGSYHLEGQFMPAPTRPTFYHLFASGVFTRIEIIGRGRDPIAFRFERKDMQEFVAKYNWKGLEAIEKLLIKPENE